MINYTQRMYVRLYFWCDSTPSLQPIVRIVCNAGVRLLCKCCADYTAANAAIHQLVPIDTATIHPVAGNTAPPTRVI